MPAGLEFIARLRGTMQSIFKVGNVNLKDNAGVAEIRNDDDSAYADLTFNDGTVNSILFDLTPSVSPEEGRLYWNSDDGTLNLGMPGGNVNLQMGQEMVLRASNRTGATITNSSVVYVNGAQGSRPTIALADADVHDIADGTIGFATEEILDNGNGYVTAFGLVRDINTGSFTAGDRLYLSSTAGAYTNIKPVAPVTTVFLGYVLFSNASSGIIFATPMTIHKIDELSDVVITSILQGHMLVWDDATSVWRNTNTVNVPTETQVGLIIQTTDDDATNSLQEWKDSGATVLASINITGEATLPKATFPDNASDGLIGLTARSAAPTSPSTGIIYLDDGTNRADSLLGFRQWNGATWDDIVDTSSVSGGNIVLLKSANYTITGNEANGEISVDVDASGGDVIITLPTALSYQNRFINVSKIDNSINIVTMDGNGSETINDSLTLIITIQNTNMRLQSNGSNFRIR